MEGHIKKPEEIWMEYSQSAKEKGYKRLNSETYDYMVDYVRNIFHSLWEEKRSKLQEKKSGVRQFVVCVYCDDLLSEPVTLLCGHTYCKTCLKKMEEEYFICLQCDNYSAKLSEWNFLRLTVLDKLETNVIISKIVQECFPTEVEASSLRLKGNLYLSKQEYVKAVEMYNASVQLCESSFKSWCNLAQAKYLQNNFSESLIAAKKSISVFPSWSKGYLQEGISYRAQSNNHEAVVSFFKYLILESTSGSAKDHLVECLKAVLPDQDMDTGTDFETQLREYMIKLFKTCLEFCLLTNPVTPKLDSSLTIHKSLEKLYEHLTCPLCFRLFYEAFTTRCGHTFCTKCLERMLDYNYTCSICRTPLNEVITVKPKPVDEVINRLVLNYFESEHNEIMNCVLRETEVIQYDYNNPDVALIPIFVCLAAFPTIKYCLHIFEPRYKLLLRRCIESKEQSFGMCMYDENESFCKYGTLLEIQDSRMLDDGRLLVNTIGGKRFKVLEKGMMDGYNTAKVQFLSDVNSDEHSEEEQKLVEDVYNISSDFLSRLPRMILSTLKLNCGEIPSLMEGADGEHGQLWIWYMFRLMVNNEVEKITEALKCRNVTERIHLIQRYIIFDLPNQWLTSS